MVAVGVDAVPLGAVDWRPACGGCAAAAARFARIRALSASVAMVSYFADAAAVAAASSRARWAWLSASRAALMAREVAVNWENTVIHR